MRPKPSVPTSQPETGEVYQEELRIVDLNGRKSLRKVAVRSNGDVIHICGHSDISVGRSSAADKPGLYEIAIADARRQVEEAFDKPEIPCTD